MVRLKKISLQNFKGIKSHVIFHLDGENTHVNVLSGPNGFGKTTIFDAIEICLTGELKRVIELFDKVQKKNNNKNKPFFQNTDGEDVILKLWLYNSNNDTNYILIKHYDDDLSPRRGEQGRDFIPSDARYLFKTYLVTDSSYFEATNFDNLAEVEQSAINELFYGEDSNIELASTYLLFNYIQQEDSIYFLRKNEDDKGRSLGFLFNIEKEEADKEKILLLKTNLSRQQSSIAEQINQLKDSLTDIQKGEYVKLFQDKEFDFDKEIPFSEISLAREQLASYLDILASLTLLKNNFSPDEYEKSIRFKRLNDDVLSNSQILKSILIKSVYTDDLINNLETTNSKISKAADFLRTHATSFILKEYFDLFLTNPVEFDAYSIIENSIKAIDLDLGEIGIIFSEINANRNQIYDQFKKIRNDGHISDKNCPLCDSTFESFEALEVAIAKKTESLKLYNFEKLRQKSIFEDQIKPFHSKITESVNAFIALNKTTEQSVLSLLREYSTLRRKTEEVYSMYPILSSPGMESINFVQAPNTMAEINEKQELLKSFLERDLLSLLSYDDRLLVNKEFYIRYFDADRTKLSEITIEMLTAKMSYLQGSYAQLANSKLTFLESRNDKLKNLINNSVNPVYEKVHQAIQDHKAEMIEKIKIPFYIYSGKILQSYQQGLGIFIEIHRTEQNNNVRFKTGHLSDHDIVYHLSSGQMAVVAIAFCLSLNKVYNTNESFKFLSIDDPLQTMDELNIHTFIELVRNEFKNYQIIISTHDDFNSRYIKYKFDKFDMNTEIQNVQKIVREQTIA